MINEKEKAAPALQHQDGSGEQTQLPGVRLPDSDCTTGAKSFQVGSMLLSGMENAIPARELVHLLGLRNSRELRRRVEYERKHGALILSMPTVGYWLPASGERGKVEARLFGRSMIARARNTALSAAAASAWAEQEADDGEE